MRPRRPENRRALLWLEEGVDRTVAYYRENIKRKWGHAQHHIKYLWKRFDTPLELRADAASVELPDIKLVAVADEASDPRLLEMVDD